MIVKEIPLSLVDISDYNTRKELGFGEDDSSLQDLARSIEKQGLLSPITVFEKPEGRFGAIAGQRRLMACRRLGWNTISAVVRFGVDESDAKALSLVENVHRADMNPHDKAVAFRSLLDRLGDVQSVSNETGIGTATIRKYIKLLDLAPELQERISSGDASHTEAMIRLSKRFEDTQKQIVVWDKLDGLTQDVQIAAIKRIEPNLENLQAVINQASEGAFAVVSSRRCPFDCSQIPDVLKPAVASMIAAFQTQQSVKQTS